MLSVMNIAHARILDMKLISMKFEMMFSESEEEEDIVRIFNIFFPLPILYL